MNREDYDSDEERIFATCLDNLLSHQVIDGWEKVEKANKITVFDGVKFDSVVLRKEVYTPDFHVYLNACHPMFEEWLKTSPPWCFKPCRKGHPLSIVECKPTFDKYNMTRCFISKQKAIYSRHEIYISLVHPKVFKKNYLSYWGLI